MERVENGVWERIMLTLKSPLPGIRLAEICDIPSLSSYQSFPTRIFSPNNLQLLAGKKKPRGRMEIYLQDSID